MNGRVYDYRLGKFLSVDPIISNPANSQSVNPYSYIGNNPLSGVDPTGYACDDFSTARCDTIWVNPPDAKPTIPSKIRIGDNGNIINTPSLNLNAPATTLLAPGDNARQTAGGETVKPRSDPGSDPMRGALALAPPPGCGHPYVCAAIVVGYLLYGAYNLATGPDATSVPPIATDATGLLKPAEAEPESVPKAATGGAGAISRGPGGPGGGGGEIASAPEVPKRPGENLVIRKMAHLTKPGALAPGERTLLPELPDRGSVWANLKQNFGHLRAAMSESRPIRDATVDPKTGKPINNTGFLRAERYFLESRGWTYRPETTR